MNYKDNNDYELLYLIKENDEDAFSFLLTKYKPLLIKYIKVLKRYLQKFPVDFEDISQDLYIIFYDSVRKYSESNKSMFYSYLVFNINNYIKDKLRFFYNQKRIPLFNTISLEQNDDFSLLNIIKDTSINIENDFLINNYFNLIYNYSFTMDMENASIFELYISGFKVSEISKLLNIKSNNVSVKINRILKKIKKELEI